MRIAVPQETKPGENRVALVPDGVATLVKRGQEVIVQSGAGTAAGYTDDMFEAAGATLVADRAQSLTSADVVAQIWSMDPERDSADVEHLPEGCVLVGMADPLGSAAKIAKLAGQNLTLFALELIPRITRAQSMDVLSSMATVAGYKAVLLAAGALPKMFPLLMTAAGTIKPARVLVLGAGVAGLQAIATAKRLGAIVSAYDVRPAAREQIESLGAKCVELKLETAGSEDKGGYAKALDEQGQQEQRRQLAEFVAESDVVVSTAAIPGKRSPLLVTADAVERMAAGSVIVDLAAERGGNCELSKPDETVVEHGVTIFGPTNLASNVPGHASQMFSKNVTNLLQLLTTKDGELHLDMSDEVIRDTMATHRGQVVHARIRDILGLASLDPPASETPPAEHLAGGAS